MVVDGGEIHAHDWLVAWAGDTLKALFDRPLVATIHATERVPRVLKCARMTARSAAVSPYLKPVPRPTGARGPTLTA